MILVVANVYLKDGKQDDFLIAAKECIASTLKEPGNISYDLNINAFDFTRFTFVEYWNSKEDLDLHMQSEHFKIFGNAIAPLLAKELEIDVLLASKI